MELFYTFSLCNNIHGFFFLFLTQFKLLANRKIKLKILYLFCVAKLKGYREPEGLHGFLRSLRKWLLNSRSSWTRLRRKLGKNLLHVADLASLVVVCCRDLRELKAQRSSGCQVLPVSCALPRVWCADLCSLGCLVVSQPQVCFRGPAEGQMGPGL